MKKGKDLLDIPIGHLSPDADWEHPLGFEPMYQPEEGLLSLRQIFETPEDWIKPSELGDPNVL